MLATGWGITSVLDEMEFERQGTLARPSTAATGWGGTSASSEMELERRDARSPAVYSAAAAPRSRPGPPPPSPPLSVECVSLGCRPERCRRMLCGGT